MATHFLDGSGNAPESSEWADRVIHLDAIPMAAFVCAPDGHILWHNPAAVALWGHAPASFESCCLEMEWLDDRELPAGHDTCPIQAVLGGTPGPCIARGRLAALATPIDVSCGPLLGDGGELLGALTLMTPHRPQAAGSGSPDEMERRFADISRRKDEFIATLAHELRQPLASMLVAVTLLRKSPGPESETRAFDVLTRQLEHMRRLADDLVDAARIAQGKVTLSVEQVVLQSVIKDAVNVVTPAMSDKQLEFELLVPLDPLVVTGDRARLQQILSNLLLNAAKYSDPGGCVRMTVLDEAGVARIKVRDAGRGIAPDLMPAIFDVFTQADSTMGLGVGLAVVKRLVQMHGGDVEVTTAGHGAGAEFTVTLPVAAAAPTS